MSTTYDQRGGYDGREGYQQQQPQNFQQQPPQQQYQQQPAPQQQLAPGGPWGQGQYDPRQAGIGEAVEYFRHHLLLRDFRPHGKRAGDPKSEQCIGDFRRFVEYVVTSQDEHGALDLPTFEQLCRRFSDEWQGTCHWLNHKILSAYLTEKIGTRWRSARGGGGPP